MAPKPLLLFAATAEIATGLALLIVPSAVGQLLLGQELTGAATPVARMLGLALVALGIAVWPSLTGRHGMLTYTAAATLYLGYLALGGQFPGKLLWPAVAAHGVLTILLALESFNSCITKTPAPSTSPNHQNETPKTAEASDAAHINKINPAGAIIRAFTAILGPEPPLQTTAAAITENTAQPVDATNPQTTPESPRIM